MIDVKDAWRRYRAELKQALECAVGRARKRMLRAV